MEPKKHFKLTNSVLYYFDSNESTQSKKSKLESENNIKYVAFNQVYRRQSYDSDFDKQWYLENTAQTINGFAGEIGVDIGWKDAIAKFSSKKDAFIAVLDSGFARNHPELSSREFLM